MIVLTALKAVIFGETTSEGVPHSMFLSCAMVPWVFFQNSLTFATTSITNNMNLVKKINFLREIFPTSVVLIAKSRQCPKMFWKMKRHEVPCWLEQERAARGATPSNQRRVSCPARGYYLQRGYATRSWR